MFNKRRENKTFVTETAPVIKLYNWSGEVINKIKYSQSRHWINNIIIQQPVIIAEPATILVATKWLSSWFDGPCGNLWQFCVEYCIYYLVISDSDEESIIKKPQRQGRANPLASPEVRRAAEHVWSAAWITHKLI